jgi:acetyl esterase/lipase
MSSRYLVDPELLALLDVLPPFHGINSETLADLRAQIEAAVELQLATTDMSGVETFSRTIAPENGPPVRLSIYRPRDTSAPLPALLHVHGGGMVMGRPEMRHAGLVWICRSLSCVVASVDYRLAPEAPFPAGIEDCYAALTWVHENAAELGVDAARIAIAGESAGGGIAACLSLLARDRNGPPVLMQMLTYPMLDDRTGTVAEHRPLAGEFVWGRSANRFGWRSLLQAEPGHPEVSPYAAAARAGDLSRLPPTFIAVGALDLFLEENLDYARRLIRAGVPTELHVYPGAFHAFDAAVDARVTNSFRRDWLSALARAFAVSIAA